MELVKNKVEDLAPYDQPLLLLLDIENEPNYVWTIGEYTPEGWITYDDWAIYQVVEWYELPFRHKNGLYEHDRILTESAEPQHWETDHGYMWLCPSCGLAIHSDYNKCVRCGNKRPSAEPKRKKGK